MKVMKSASIVSIGNEILSGETVDTNAAYLSRGLLCVGISVVSSYTVGDDVEKIAEALGLAAKDGDVVLVTGGLGPTDDDVTRQGVASLLGVELEFDGELFEQIKGLYARIQRSMPQKNRVQAYLPKGARGLANSIGTAPGIRARFNETDFYVLPGVPCEMERMFEESVLPELEKRANKHVVVVRKVKCFGTGESNIAELLGSLMERGRNPLVNITCGQGVITLHIVATACDEKAALEMAGKDEAILRSKLGDLVFGSGDQSLSEVIGIKLRQSGSTVSVAESCTGGLVAKLLTDVAGSSDYFTYGWVTYSNESKISELGVDLALIEKNGAVSEEVAVAMAVGARFRSGSAFSIGITGIAGPGCSESKAVGLVYISIDSEDGSEVWKRNFRGERCTVRRRAAYTALNLLRLKLQD